MTATQLDLLDAIHPFTTTGIVHNVMPNMALACGETVLTIPAGDGVCFGDRYPITCPACLAVPDVQAQKHAMQRRQA